MIAPQLYAPNHQHFFNVRLDFDLDVRANTVQRIDVEAGNGHQFALGLIRKAAGVGCRLHHLRHTFCTRLAEAGVPESTMLALMGHLNRAMLERYSHIRMAAKREGVAAITLRPMVENSEGVPVKVPVLKQAVKIQ